MGEVGRLVLGGGKRLRPAFCYWAFVGYGGAPDDEVVIDAGCALELMHAFALFHDDVMDDAATRRGIATTHTIFADDHSSSGWAGESRRFGEGVAILVGDLTFVYSDMMLERANPVAWKLWNELRIEVNVGQLLDIVGSVRGVRDVGQAERIATYKSAKYTIERPLHLGAALAIPDRFDEVSGELSAYGLPLGIAFQMRDDVMGTFGEAGVTGKPVGDDLREGKPTPLLARAVAAATPAQRAILDRAGDPDLSDATIREIQSTIRATGALDELEATIARLSDQALRAVEDLHMSAEAKDQLAELAEFVINREV